MFRTARLSIAGAAGALLFGAGAFLEAGPPALLAEARYVALGYDLGGGFVTEFAGFSGALPEDREALRKIREEIEAAGRFVLTDNSGMTPDLRIAVRTGRRATVGGGIRVGSPGGLGQVGTGGTGGLGISSSADLIEVFDGRGGSLIWRGMKSKGLSGDGPPLWTSFLDEVAKAERAAKKPPKP